MPEPTSRRTFLKLGLGVLGAGVLSACAPSPVVQRGSTAGPESVSALRRSVAQAELNAASQWQDVAQRASELELGGETAAWADAVRVAHQSHARLLLQGDPLGGTAASSTPLVELSAAAFTPVTASGEAWAQLSAAEQQIVAALDLNGIEPGAERMLWVALSVFAQGLADVILNGPDRFGAAVSAGKAVPARIEVGTSNDAYQVVFSHLHPLIYCLQTWHGRNYGTGFATELANREVELVNTRDRLETQLRAAGDTPPPPDEAYPLDWDGTEANARALWNSKEGDLMAALVRLGSAQDADTTVVGEAARALIWSHGNGGAIAYWPGWV